MKNISIVTIVILTIISCRAASDESFEEATTACMEGFNSCRDFMANRRCWNRSIWKRQSRADASGPFWANRGRRDPMFTVSRLYAQEPEWTLVRRDDDSAYDPYFTTRGKKHQDAVRDRRTQEKVFDGVSPFLAARGKKNKLDINKYTAE